MSWVSIAPPMLSCGRPPCPICYRWAEPSGQTIPAIERISVDLLGLAWRELTEEKKKELEEFANKLHESPIVIPEPDEPIEPAPAGEYFEVRALELRLKGLRKPEPPKPRVLTIDEIEDRKQAKKEKEAAEKKAKEERFQPLREFAQEMAKIQKANAPDPLEVLRGRVPEDFLEYARSRGMTDPLQVEDKFQKYQYGNSAPRYDYEKVMTPYYDPWKNDPWRK